MSKAYDKRVLISVSLLAGACLHVHAAEWTTAANVTPGVTYTDNVCLSEDNKQDEWIGTITPEGSIAANGNRANLNLTGSITFNTLTDDDLEDFGCTSRNNLVNRNQYEPRLNGSADATLVENWFYIDGVARVYQNEVSPFVSGGDDTFNRTGNTNTTYNYSISPYVSRRFKDVAELYLAYTFDEQINSSDVVRDSTQHSVQAIFGDVPGQSLYGWSIQGDYSKVSYDSEVRGEEYQDSELSSAQLNQSYQLNRTWQVNGFLGQEWNDFVSDREDIDGTIWDVGLRWTPNARTTVDVGVGERFFGSNPRFAINHYHKRSAFSATYAKTITYNRNIRALENSPPLNPDFPPPPGVNPGLTSLSERPLLDERFTLGYSWQGRRTGFGVSAFYSEQTESGDASFSPLRNATFSGFSFSANRSLSQYTSIQFVANWNETEPDDVDNGSSGRFTESEGWTALLSANRQLSTRTNIALSYVYTDRESDSEINNYTENRVALDFRIDL